MQKEYLLYKLQNVLRADASNTLEDRMISLEEKKERIKVIEELKKFLDDYDYNMSLFKKAKAQEKNIER